MLNAIISKYIYIENYIDIYTLLKHIENNGYIKFSTNINKKNILIIYFKNEYLHYFNSISTQYNGIINKFNNDDYSISIYDIFILEYLSTFYSSLNTKIKNKLYIDYLTLYNYQYKYFNDNIDNLYFLI